MDEPVAADPVAAVSAVLDRRQVRTVFQPLVHLVDAEVVGYEALSRGPEGSAVEDPLLLLDAARRAGRLEELDWLCAAAASHTAHGARLHPSMTIFLNFKPETLMGPYPEDMADDIRRARSQLRIVVEIDEEDLRCAPAVALQAASRARADGWGVALDNVGATPVSLALLPVLHPDVVKLDLRLLAEHRDQDAAEIETAVRTYAEMSGAAVLAQRVESDEDILSARAFGATYGQGWRYGRPGPLTADRHVPLAPFGLLRTPEIGLVPTPFEVVSRQRESAPTERRMLDRITSVIEHRAVTNGAPTVLLACVHDAAHLDSATRVAYRDLARQASFTAVFGAHMSGVDLADVHVVDLAPTEPLCREWNLIVVGPNYSGALVARDRGEGGEGAHHRYDHIVTHDRELVVQAARSVLRWIGRQG